MKTKLFLGASALLFAAGFASCQEKEPEENKAPVFPEREEVIVSAGAHGTLEFEASHDWELTVNEDWFRFAADDEDTEGTTETSGVAGAVSIDYFVTEEGLDDFLESDAEIQLTMEGVSKIVFDVTAEPMDEDGAVMFVKPITGDNVRAEGIEFEFNGSNSGQFNVGFMAAFDWEIESVPEGVSVEDKYIPAVTHSEDTDKDGVLDEEEDLDGDGKISIIVDEPAEYIEFEDLNGQLTQFRYISIAPDFIGYALPDDAKIVIKDRQSDRTAEFPISYPGMGEDDIIVSPGVLTRSGANFSKEGFVLDVSTGDATNSEVQTGRTFVREMDYSLFVVEYDLEAETSTDITADGWVTATEKEDGNFEFSVAENTGAAREAYLLILPKAYADAPKLNDFAQVGTYIDGGYAIKVSQETGETSTGGDASFAINWGSMQESVAKGAVNQDFSPFGTISHNRLPEDPSRIWAYRFPESAINGLLWIAPLGFPWNINTGSWVVKETYQAPGNWATVGLEPGNVYPGGMMEALEAGIPTIGGVKLTVTANNGTPGAALLFFYQDKTVFDAGGKADAVILLIQNPPTL